MDGDFIQIMQTTFVEGFECTISRLIPMYPKFQTCPAPIVKIIARGGSSEKASGVKTSDSAAKPSPTPIGFVS
jgi:hypothetical protein